MGYGVRDMGYGTRAIEDREWESWVVDQFEFGAANSPRQMAASRLPAQASRLSVRLCHYRIEARILLERKWKILRTRGKSTEVAEKKGSYMHLSFLLATCWKKGQVSSTEVVEKKDS